MIPKIIYVITLIMLLLSSCSISENNFVTIKLQFENLGNEKIQQSIELIENRLIAFDADIHKVTSKVVGSNVDLKVHGLSDTIGIRELLTWDRTMLLSYAINPSSYAPIQEYLSEYIEIPAKNKPYKSSSMIGLVNSNDVAIVDSIIATSNFRKLFPEVKDSYYGVKTIAIKQALFLSSTDSPIIDESMYDKVGGHSIKQDTVGALSFKLNEKYAEKIGQLTGNDSTYLLHIFHDKVYISKIIEPHITEPSFGMEGAFTPLDARMLAALWNSEEFDVSFRILSLDIITS